MFRHRLLATFSKTSFLKQPSTSILVSPGGTSRLGLSSRIKVDRRRPPRLPQSTPPGIFSSLKNPPTFLPNFLYFFCQFPAILARAIRPKGQRVLKAVGNTGTTGVCFAPILLQHSLSALSYLHSFCQIPLQQPVANEFGTALSMQCDSIRLREHFLQPLDEEH